MLLAAEEKDREREIVVYFAYEYMGLVTTKPVFGVSDKARLKPDSSATETSLKIYISPVACFDMIPPNKRITKVLIRLCGCVDWSVPLLFKNS